MIKGAQGRESRFAIRGAQGRESRFAIRGAHHDFQYHPHKNQFCHIFVRNK